MRIRGLRCLRNPAFDPAFAQTIVDPDRTLLDAPSEQVYL